MLLLVISFFMVALAYATVGFGGGSSYIALLAVSNFEYTLIPKVSLICNILVVTGGCYHYLRNKHIQGHLALPLIVSSVPMAFIGGLFPLKESSFFLLLTGCLLLCALRILFLSDSKSEDLKTPPLWSLGLTGALLGLLSGLVGIGGGIFLSPLLINLRWARSKEAAAIASLFILANSLAGLTGQILKTPNLPDLTDFFPLFLAVLIGGQIGSRISTHSKTSYSLIQKTTGVLTLIICLRLLHRIF